MVTKIIFGAFVTALKTPRKRNKCREKIQTGTQRFQKTLLFRTNHAMRIINRFSDLRVLFTHDLQYLVQQSIHERLFEIESLISVTHSSPENSPDHIAATHVRGQHAICNREGNGARMVGDHTHGDPAFFLFRIVTTSLRVRRATLQRRQRCDLIEDGQEQVGVIIAGLILQHSHDPLQTHSGVDVLGRKRLQ